LWYFNHWFKNIYFYISDVEISVKRPQRLLLLNRGSRVSVPGSDGFWRVLEFDKKAVLDSDHLRRSISGRLKATLTTFWVFLRERLDVTILDSENLLSF
jgi:hypothetical protein